MTEQSQSQPPAGNTSDMSWVLNRLTKEKDVLHAVLLSIDGLVIHTSDGLDRAVADRTAANASGFLSMGRSISEFAERTDTAPRKIIIDVPGGCILIFGAGHRSVLAVSVGAEMTSKEVAVATAATLKAIGGLRDALSARERTAYTTS